MTNQWRNPNRETKTARLIRHSSFDHSFDIRASSFELFSTEIGLQFFRNPHRTVRLLIALDQRCKQSGQRHARAIQCVAKPVFPIEVLESKLHPAGLELLAV